MTDDLRRQAYLKRLMDPDDVSPSTNVTQPSSIHQMQPDSQSGMKNQNLPSDYLQRTISSGINEQKLMLSLGVPEVVTTKIDTLSKENEDLKSQIQRLSSFAIDSIAKIHELGTKLTTAKLGYQMIGTGLMRNFNDDTWFENHSLKKKEERVEELKSSIAQTKNAIQKSLLKNELESLKKKIRQIEDTRAQIYSTMGSAQDKYYPSMLINDGKIQLLEKIGHGGFATVWKAFDYEQAMVVAVKITNMFNNSDVIKMSTHLKREHDIMKATNSKNVVNIFN